MQEINKKNCRTWSRLGQRGTVCGVALPELMESNDNIYTLTADLGHLSGLDRVKNNFPSRFINVGIAEQNMIGVAAGLAFEGNVVYATTYATFLSMRCYEQIRHNLGYQRANVKLLGSASGLAMGMSGNTHYSYEDIAIMRAIPNMMIVSPADSTEAYQAMFAINEYMGPVYLRLTGNLNEPPVFTEPYEFRLGKAVTIKEGKEVVLISTGNVLRNVKRAAERLEQDGISTAVVNMHTVKPLDTDTLKRYLDAKWIVSIEEHNIIGGLGGAIAEYLAEEYSTAKFMRIGIPDIFVHPADYDKLQESSGLTEDKIYESLIKKIGC